MADVFVGEVAERTGDRLVDDHLAELAHDEERHDACDRIAEQHGRAGHLDRLRDAEEQPRAERAAERDQLDVPVLQPRFRPSFSFPETMSSPFCPPPPEAVRRASVCRALFYCAGHRSWRRRVGDCDLRGGALRPQARRTCRGGPPSPAWSRPYAKIRRQFSVATAKSGCVTRSCKPYIMR
jgi:hypothetical protein